MEMRVQEETAIAFLCSGRKKEKRENLIYLLHHRNKIQTNLKTILSFISEAENTLFNNEVFLFFFYVC